MVSHNKSKTYDYIVVGAGSAGCVLANRLSENPMNRVCLIEGGGSESSMRVQIPAGILSLYGSKKYDYCFQSVPQKYLYNRILPANRGKALGGSSSINSMLYIRGAAEDYDEWEQLGCIGWSYQEVLKYFKKSEQNLLNQDPAFHGKSGELKVDKQRDPNTLSYKFIKAANNIFIPENKDFNAESQEGVGIYDVTQDKGKRYSSYRAFIEPVKNRKNLTIITDCTVTSLSIVNKTVRGLSFEKEGEKAEIFCKKEVILSAGAFGSPQILLASGIGCTEELDKVGVKVKHDLKGVGKNLQDHVDGLVTVRSSSSRSLGISFRKLPEMISSLFRYKYSRKGMLTTNYVEAGGFTKTKFADGLSDIQFHFVPGYRSHRGRIFEFGHGYAIHTCVLRPKSIGSVYLADDGSKRNLAIDYNFFDNKEDADVLVEGIKKARQILADREFSSIRGEEMLPGKHVQTDEEILEYLQKHCQHVYHPVGTCKMGIDEMSVVTPELKVIGIDNLRVADASIMPKLIGGNTNAPSIMIGEKCADMILSETK